MHISKVFWYAIIICLGIVLWGGFAPEHLNSFTTDLTAIIYDNFGWLYVFIIAGMILFCLYMLFSKFGHIKLGQDDDEPEYSLPAWFAMLFSAGMGIGLVFFSTAETISHAFITAANSAPGSEQAIRESLQYTSLHWGIHGWAMYSVVGLILAYFKFRKGAPGLISATLEPIFGQKIMRGFTGQAIDTLAIFATVVGVASTLGFGSAQINSGLTFLFNAPKTFWFQVIILIVATLLFIMSAWSGIGKGIKYLSSINMWIAGFLLLAVFIVGPTTYILDMLTTSVGNYLSNFVSMSFELQPTSIDKRQWINDWTVFYWAWWISWSPFVGMFIARVSKGRTIRQFITGVLLAPTLVTIIFFGVFGSSALFVESTGLAKLSDLVTETVTFGMLEQMPFGVPLSFLLIIVIAIFFVTSADSATFVLGMFSTGGQLNPSNAVKITWGVILSAMAAVVMYSGGISGLQNLLIIAGLPFSIVLVLMVISFYLSVKKEVD